MPSEVKFDAYCSVCGEFIETYELPAICEELIKITICTTCWALEGVEW